MQKEEYLIKNACYSLTKYYLCKQNNKRSLLGRKQRNQVTRSFLNRYQFSSTNKVTSLFSISCILRIIFTWQNNGFWHAKGCFLQSYSSARFMRAANWKSAGTRMQNEKSSPKYIERSLPWK